MKDFLIKNLNLPGGMFIGLGLPIGVHILPGNYDLLFLPFGMILIMMSFYQTFIKK